MVKPNSQYNNNKIRKKKKKEKRVKENEKKIERKKRLEWRQWTYWNKREKSMDQRGRCKIEKQIRRWK